MQIYFISTKMFGWTLYFIFDLIDEDFILGRDFCIKMRILVTGGAGFIGSHVCENLLARGCEVIVLDDLSTGTLDNLVSIKSRITFFKSRIEDFDFNIIKHIDSVIHLAAQASVPLSITDFYNSSETNILSSLKIVDYCLKYKLPLVYASSSAIYGGLKLGDDEKDHIDLISPYAADKFALGRMQRFLLLHLA